MVTLLRDLFTVLGWEQGVHYQVVALQAVMAQLMGGDTIHHACGIPAFKKGTDDDSARASQQSIAKRVLQWRWLIIDEISMVSARLLADVDMKLRSVVRDVVPLKRDADKETRPFGGLNVLCCGDFWQLDPPEGGSLADIPVEWIQRARKYAPAPTISHGQSLFWAGAAFGMQGQGNSVGTGRGCGCFPVKHPKQPGHSRKPRRSRKAWVVRESQNPGVPRKRERLGNM